LSFEPVTPRASKEAVALLQYLHAISGQKTLAGQHCVPLVGSTRLMMVYRATGRYPALFGQDFGFAAPGDWDGINFRQRLVDEAILRHHDGFIITLMWHAVRPIDDEPVTFEESVQGKVSAADWEELITPGTRLNDRWKSQVDVIAWHLRQLQYANVPVIWRPYHEMNGGWFWWGRKPGERGYKALYRMMFDRLVHYHNIRNLVWVYNCNELGENIDSYESHYPGDDVVDILATDVYRQGFSQRDYDQLLALAAGRPIALGEVGAAPSIELLHSQPRWAWFMSWGDPQGPWKADDAYHSLYQHPRVATLRDLPWVKDAPPGIHHPVIR